MTPNDFIAKTLENASDIAKKYFGKVSESIKFNDPSHVVTKADTTIGSMIVASVLENYPDNNVIDEETGIIDNGSEYTWVIDPIDGTSNFAAGLETYGIMLGLLHNNIPLCAGISLPSFGRYFWAEKGKGAYCNGNKITITKETNMNNLLIAYGIDANRHDPNLTREEVKVMGEIVLESRNLRSSNSAYDSMMVAWGKYGGILNKTTRIWDNVAPQIILEEAGAIYTDFNGKDIDYNNPFEKIEKNYTLCAAAPAVHTRLQQIIHSM